MKRKCTPQDHIGASFISTDKRVVSIRFCKNRNMWLLAGRRPHKKTLEIGFSREAMDLIIAVIAQMKIHPSIINEVSYPPQVQWKQLKPR